MEQVLLSEEMAKKVLHILNNMPEQKMSFEGEIISSYVLAAELTNLIEESPNQLHLTWSVVDVIARHQDNNGVDADDVEAGEFPEGFTDVTIEEAREIIKEIDNDNDANSGVTWSTIDYYLDQLFNNIEKHEEG